jgi:asparagine synthase (glutamine-hydrolysing)
MCGVAGYVSLNGERADPALVGRMLGMLRHRGPDDSGVYSDECAGLGHARLSIIDLAGGHQPMHNEDRSLWISFNGEIFNYLELRQDLLNKGHRFATRSDTEVILHLFEEKGADCVHDLNGQWAFAIWDTRAKHLFLSRDRLGVRPLFYTRTPGAFVFGSEIKSLFAHPEATRELDPRAIDQIFTFWCALPPRTAFKGVCELPPGHSLTLERGEAVVRRYWSLGYGGEVDGVSEEESACRLRELLIDAVRIRLRSDVPVGAYLSGGLDSTLTTALIKGYTSAPLRTFSVRFEDDEFDESAYQREAAQYLGTDHEEVLCSSETIGQVFPDVIWHTEKPILRTAPAPLYCLSKLVRDRGYKVVITGEGSDEMFGGYDIFKEAKIRRFWAAHPESEIRPMLLRRLYPYLPNVQSQPDSYRKAFFHIDPADLASPLFSHLPRWETTARAKLFFSDALKSEIGSYDGIAEIAARLPEAYRSWRPFCQAQYLEAEWLLPGYILSSQGDRMAMAHSVEGRFPFLDYRVVEFASHLPPRMKMKALNEKYLVKLCAQGLIPPSVARRSKQPYRAPEGKSFFPEQPLEYVEDLLSEERLRRDGIFVPAAVGRLKEKVRSGRAIGAKDNMALAGILSTELLLDQFGDSFARRV